ncbi:MAG: YezD family protein [Pirellulales bacterium]
MSFSPRMDLSDNSPDLQELRRALSGIQFGTVNIVIQDGLIVQIDRTEKRRIRRKMTKDSERDDLSNE